MACAGLAPDRSDPFVAQLNPDIALYCVGGAVRDALMGSQAVDRDYLVVGAKPEDLLNAGFKPVGKDFPVFLHPVSKEEYALARRERKVGKGYRGFEALADPSVSLEDDLSRRDLSINAMAVDEQGQLHDPYHGLEDLQLSRLRHVSPAFREDPVRLLRLARFLSRWPEFEVSPDTRALCEAMREDGELEALVAERVWQELFKGLKEKAPGRMLEFLAELHLLGSILGLSDTNQTSALQTRLNRASACGLPSEVKAALLFEEAAGPLRLKLPKKVSEWIALLPHFASLKAQLNNQKAWPVQLTAWARQNDVFRRPERLETMALLGALLLAEDSLPDETTRWQAQWTRWIRLCKELSELSVSTLAQRYAKEGPAAIQEAIENFRRSYIESRLAESTIND